MQLTSTAVGVGGREGGAHCRNVMKALTTEGSPAAVEGCRDVYGRRRRNERREGSGKPPLASQVRPAARGAVPLAAPACSSSKCRQTGHGAMIARSGNL